MAGRPKTKAKLDALTQEAEAARAEVATYRARLIAAGIDPDTLNPQDTSEQPGFTLEDYSPSLPDQVIALAEEGQDIAEIRITLRFTAIQENQWKDRYVRFAAALARAHEMNHAYWMRQYRSVVASGDRSQANAILALIDKRFMSGGGRGDASKLVNVKTGPKRQAAAPAMVAAE
jgi:hypothetical protein